MRFSDSSIFVGKRRLNAMLIVLLFTPLSVLSQRDLKTASIFTPVYGLTYKGSVPGGDFADRWGFVNSIGAEVNFKLKSNLTFGVEAQFLFGSTFKQNEIFNNLLNEDGNITNTNGIPSEVLLMLRGGNYTAQIGYVFTGIGKGPNAGLWLNAGVGFMHHKIRIEHTFDEIPQFDDPYKQGYDKLTMGLVSKQFVGWLQQGSRQFLNFYAGFEFMQGFTRNVRTFNFDSGGPEPDLRLDLFYGFKLGWMIPIYKRQLQEYYYD